MKEVQVDVGRCIGCKSCEIACAVEHSTSKELFGAIFEATPPRKRIFVQDAGEKCVPVNCRHCEEAFCVRVCPTGAMYRKGALVLHKRNLCIGCGFCELACPFGAITRSPGSKLVTKCDLCPDRNIPACVSACPTNALSFITPEEAQRKKRRTLAEQMCLP
ncbi:MAG TPA: 4Fe-4S dicluster domain-containing protein [Syntrophomonadaceae bacterium]|nr:4Fe-4S dicluster domain-containing protein [Syntrophomonadaceae bacterium]